jgi:hypothetical protein
VDESINATGIKKNGVLLPSLSFLMYERCQVILRIIDVMKLDVISVEYPAQLAMAEAVVHQSLGERHQ